MCLDQIYTDQLETASSNSSSTYRAATHKSELLLSLLAETRCPEDVIAFGKRHGIPTFAEMTWIRGFAQGLEFFRKMHLSNLSNAFFCNWCGAEFKNNNELLDHLHNCSSHNSWKQNKPDSKIIPLINTKVMDDTHR